MTNQPWVLALIVMAVTLCALAAVAVLMRGRRNHKAAVVSGRVSSKVAAVGSLALVPLPSDPSMFLALGDVRALPAESIMPTTLLSTESVARSIQAITLAANVPLQFASAVQQSSNLVRLTPETVAALKTGANFMKSGGVPTGVLRGSNGQITQLVRFTAVSGALGAVAGLSQAVTMAAMQMQLADISKKLDALKTQIELVDRGLSNERLAEIESLSMSVQHSLGQCNAAGAVPDKVIADIAGKSQQLDAHIRRLEMEIRGRLSRVPAKGSTTSTLTWLAQDGIVGVDELSQMLVAIQGWLIHRALYAANLGKSGDVADVAAQTEVITQTVARRTELEEQVTHLAYEIDRALHIAEVAPGKLPKSEWVVRKFNTSSKISSKQVTDLAGELRAMLDSAGVPVRAVEPLREAINLGHRSTEGGEEWRELLPYLLRNGEEPLLFVHGSGVGGNNNASASRSVMVFTDMRVLGLRKKSFLRDAHFSVMLERPTIDGAKISRAGVGKIPVPGWVLRTYYDGGSVDISLDAATHEERQSIESAARRALDSSAPVTDTVMPSRPAEIEGVPQL